MNKPLRVILNADDFGYSQETVEATIECFEKGALTSATIMANMPATGQAIAYALGHPQFSFGAHLTYVDEVPLSNPAHIPALVTPEGRFRLSQEVRLAALRCQIPMDQIVTETTAQLSLLRDAGVPLSHVDSHGHLHKFRPFVNALRSALPRFGISRLRSVQDVYVQRPLKSPTYWCGFAWRRRIKAAFSTTDHFAMPACDEPEGWCELILQRAGRGVLEVGVHPGYAEAWRNCQRVGIVAFHAAASRVGCRFITWDDVPMHQ